MRTDRHTFHSLSHRFPFQPLRSVPGQIRSDVKRADQSSKLIHIGAGPPPADPPATGAAGGGADTEATTSASFSPAAFFVSSSSSACFSLALAICSLRMSSRTAADIVRHAASPSLHFPLHAATAPKAAERLCISTSFGVSPRTGSKVRATA